MGPPWSFLVENEFYEICGRVVAHPFAVELVEIVHRAQQPVLNLYCLAVFTFSAGIQNVDHDGRAGGI